LVNKPKSLNRLFRTALFLFLSLWVSNLIAQNSLNSIDLKKVTQKKVRRYVRQQQDEQIQHFSELETSVSGKDELSEFMSYEKDFVIKEERDFVWDNYTYSSQTDVWDLNKISFGFLFDRNTESIVYANQIHYGLEKGQIFYLNLRILNGIYNLPVAFEIIDVDRENMQIEFSYLKGGKTSGKQTIQLEETEEGYTRIVHRSFVKSNSKIRDKYLYPYFHNKLIHEFHNNMKKVIVRQAKSAEMNLAEIE